MTCESAYSQEREEKEKARAHLDREEGEKRDGTKYRDTQFEAQDSDGNFIDDVFFLTNLIIGRESSGNSSSSLVEIPEDLAWGVMLAAPPFPNSGLGFGLGFYGSSDEGLAGYLELKAVGGIGEPTPFYGNEYDWVGWSDETVDSFRRAFCLNIGIKKAFAIDWACFGGLGWVNTSGYMEKLDELGILGDSSNLNKYFVPDSTGDSNKLNFNFGLLFRPRDGWGLTVSHDTALSMTSFGIVFGGH